MATTGSADVRLHAHWPKTALRVTFGVIWLIDASLKWLPGFRAGYADGIKEGAGGQPGWLKGWFDFWINLQEPRATFFAFLVAVVETLIAVALIVGFARKLTYVGAIVFSLMIWSTAEGFGGPYTAGSADIGTAVIYALVFASLLTFAYYQGASRYSVDYYLEQRISWWHRVAEVEPHHRRTARHAESSASGAAQPVSSPVSASVDGQPKSVSASHSNAQRPKSPAGRP